MNDNLSAVFDLGSWNEFFVNFEFFVNYRTQILSCTILFFEMQFFLNESLLKHQ